MTPRQWLWNAAGLAALATGTIGIVVPLLPTVPFYILAAFCFARGNRAWEARLLAHPRYGPPMLAWREKGAISRQGKTAATIAFAVSIAIGLWLLAWPWLLLPVVAALLCLSWLWTRPDE
jgi:uncharacterized protein